MLKFIRLLVLALVYHSPISLSGQTENSIDSAVYFTALKGASSKSLLVQKAINIGSEYNDSQYNFKNNGHPYFLSRVPLIGEITYNHILYKDIELQYDLIQDEVVVENFSGRKIVLVKEKITDFTLEGHHFRKILPVTDHKLVAGFYNVLVSRGELELLARREKKIKGLSSNFNYKTTASYVEENTTYFLIRGGNYFQVKNYKNIVKILSTDEKSLEFHKPKGASKEVQMIDVVMQHSERKD